jgi:beta-phosphoglucomutase family hydrolase
MNSNSTLKAIIFDMDGVLIDSEPLHFEVDLMLLKELKINQNKDYLERFVGFTNPAMWQVIKSEYYIEKSIEELISLQNRLKLEYLEESNYNAISGIEKLLSDIKNSNISIGIASSSPRIFIEAVIKKIGISNYFDTWASGEDVENSKPEPDVFLKCAELLEVNPMECIAIEDSKSGTIAAKKAGMKCIGFRNLNSGNQDLSNADIVIDKIEEINVDRIRMIFQKATNR